jgi:hypothetical protein
MDYDGYTVVNLTNGKEEKGKGKTGRMISGDENVARKGK